VSTVPEQLQTAMDFVTNAAPGRADRIEMDKIEWIQQVLDQIPEPRRERLLLCLAAYGSKVSARDPLFGTLDAMGILSTAWIDVSAKVGETAKAMQATAEAVQQARNSAREAVEFAASSFAEEVTRTANNTKTLLEDVRSSLVQAVSPAKLSAAFSEETTRQFGEALRPLMEKQLAAAIEVITPRMTKWVEETVDKSLEKASKQMDKAVESFRGRLFGALRWVHFALVAAGSLATVAAFLLGHFWPYR
jgi:hypothetical protein